MNKGVAKQAHKRLLAAEKKAKALAHSRSLEEITDLWSEFLTEQQRFFNRLGNAMETPSEQGRWAKILSERKNHPLLSYLLHARNADEHGHGTITTIAPPGFALGVDGEPIVIENLTYAHGSITSLKARNLDHGGPAKMRFEPAKISAARVVDRGEEYEPPSDESVSLLALRALHLLEGVYGKATQSA